MYEVYFRFYDGKVVRRHFADKQEAIDHCEGVAEYGDTTEARVYHGNDTIYDYHDEEGA